MKHAMETATNCAEVDQSSSSTWLQVGRGLGVAALRVAKTDLAVGMKVEAAELVGERSCLVLLFPNKRAVALARLVEAVRRPSFRVGVGGITVGLKFG